MGRNRQNNYIYPGGRPCTIFDPLVRTRGLGEWVECNSVRFR